MLSTILIILFFCFFVCLAWRNLIWATAFVVAFLPSYLIRFNLGPIPLTLLEGMILILFITWSIKSLRARPTKLAEPNKSASIFQNYGIASTLKRLATTGWWWTILLWLAVATISMFVSPDLRAAAGIWKAYFIEPILFFIVFVSVIKEKKDLELIFYALGFSALYISAFAIYQKFTGIAIPNPIWQAAETRRVTSFYGYPNAVGLYLAPIVTLYVGWLFNKILNTKYEIQNAKKLLTVIYQLLIISLSIFSIIFARSEGAYAGILVGLIFLGLMIKKLRWPTVMATILLVILILSVPQFKNYVWQQISFQNDSGKVRLIMWQETWQMLKDRPILGAGLAGYQQTFVPYHKAKYIEIYLYPHNLFLNFWSELGLAGLFIFLFIVFQFFKLGFKDLIRNWKLEIGNYKERKIGKTLLLTSMATMITIIIHGLVDVPYFKNDLSILFWLLIAASIVLKNNKTLDKTQIL
jgi:O-antigen ligase